MALKLKQRNDGYLEEVNQRYNYTLVGTIDGVNQDFKTDPHKFTQETGDQIRVFLNGQRLVIVDDYTVSESGGVGTGYDTVTFVEPPRQLDHVTADFTPNG